MRSTNIVLVILVISALMLFPISSGIAQDITEGLILYLAFDETDADVVEDLSGKGNNAAIIGDPEWVAGKINKGMRFDAGTDLLEIPFSETLTPEDAMTMAVWVNFDGVDKLPSQWGGVIVDDYLWNADGLLARGYFLSLEAAQVRGCFLGDGTSEHCWVFEKHPPKERWTHIAVTWDGAAIQAYMDGEPQKHKLTGLGAVLWAGPIGTNQVADMHIAGKAGGVQGYPGVLDELAIYNRGLSADEVTRLMTQGVSFPVEPAGKLAAMWGTLKAR